MSGIDTDRVDGPHWPASGPAVALLYADSPAEEAVLGSWVARAAPGADVVAAGGDGLGPVVTTRDDDVRVVPLRLAWLGRGNGHHLASLLTGMTPDPVRARLNAASLRLRPEQWRVVAGEPATLGELRARFVAETGGRDGESFAAFVARQGALALERVVRQLTGSPKVPHFVEEEILASARFHDGVSALAGQLGRTRDDVEAEAAGYLAEMAATQSPLALAVWGRIGRFAARAYRFDVDEARLTELSDLGRRGALVFLPSHRSYLDPFVLRAAMQHHLLPPNHVLGGLNVAFWPVGPLARRSGYVFIRRSIRDNPVYRFALREYVAYLVRKRFNLEWYLEGGRSRTGKLRPPRLGLLAYLVDAFTAGGGGDVTLVPVSIVYDQLYEVAAMAAEEHGANKRRESLGWALGYARAQGRRLGSVHVRFGEPLPLAEGLAAAESSGDRSADRFASRRAVEKLAFEVLHRINRATPVTPTALVTLALLGTDDRALTLDEVRAALAPFLDYVDRRRLPVAGDVDLVRPAGVRATLDGLAREGVLGCFSSGDQPVWSVERHLEAAYYRNGIAHHFVNRAIVELVAAQAATKTAADPLTEAWEEALRLRDLLKFEFFFARKRAFAGELTAELECYDVAWSGPEADPKTAWTDLTRTRLFAAHRILRSFLEAYLVVAERLAQWPPPAAVDHEAFVADCLGVAQQWRLQQRIASTESVSAELFRSGLRLAANRGLLEPDAPGIVEDRAAFAAEVRGVVDRVAAVHDAARGAFREAAT